MAEEWAELLANFPAYLGGHLLLSTLALWAGLAISLPLGVAASRRPKLAELSLGVAGILQTVPSLALLGLAVLVLGGLTGLLPAFLVLVLYSVLPILANTVVAIRGVDPALTEAARGLGMSGWQMLHRVELPLAAPVILAGVRTATVLVVGTATLATPVGAPSLGNYIFAGLATLNHLATVFGCVMAALLALVLDQLVRLLEVAARRRSRRLAWGAAAGLLLVTLVGLYHPLEGWLRGKGRPVVSAMDFSEQYILSQAISRRLEAAGFEPQRLDGMSFGIQMQALRRGRVSCIVTYTGDVWAVLMKERESADRATIRKQVERFLVEDFGVHYVGLLGFDDAYALAMTKRLAQRWRVESIDDLARHSQTLGRPLKIAGDLAFFERREWQELKKRHAWGDVEIVAMEPTLMYTAAENEVDVVVAYTSDGRIRAYDLQLLEDTKNVFPSYDAILLASPDAALDPKFLGALEPLVGAIRQGAMQEANRLVDVDGQSPAAAARWLLEATVKARPAEGKPAS